MGNVLCLADKNISSLEGWDEMLEKWNIKRTDIGGINLKENNITILPKDMFTGLNALKQVSLRNNPRLKHHFDDGTSFYDCPIRNELDFDQPPKGPPKTQRMIKD